MEEIQKGGHSGHEKGSVDSRGQVRCGWVGRNPEAPWRER